MSNTLKKYYHTIHGTEPSLTSFPLDELRTLSSQVFVSVFVTLPSHSFYNALGHAKFSCLLGIIHAACATCVGTCFTYSCYIAKLHTAFCFSFFDPSAWSICSFNRNRNIVYTIRTGGGCRWDYTGNQAWIAAACVGTCFTYSCYIAKLHTAFCFFDPSACSIFSFNRNRNIVYTGNQAWIAAGCRWTFAWSRTGT